MKKPKAKRRVSAQPKRVDFTKNETDLAVVVLGMMGLSNKCIKRKTQLTNCQVTYRLHKAGVKRLDYRNGESKAFDLIYDTTHGEVAKLFDW